MIDSSESVLVWSLVNFETIKFMDPHLKNLNSNVKGTILLDNGEIRSEFSINCKLFDLNWVTSNGFSWLMLYQKTISPIHFVSTISLHRILDLLSARQYVCNNNSITQR